MKKKEKQVILIFAVVIVAIWLLTPASHPAWIKHIAMASTACLVGLVLTLFHLFKVQPNVNKKGYFGLTEKIYTVSIFASATIYGLGIWLVTPETDPTWLKPLFLGLGSAACLFFAIFFGVKKIAEQPDERLYINLGKAAAVCLGVTLSGLLVLTGLLFFTKVNLSAGMVLIVIAGLMLAFDLAYFIFEKLGQLHD
ncbi:DUF3796 domain-containing protein [Streptococcus caprae]|uniref:DUF3796 domain-containing protein n=1 Tax=Streptococcus caprae TaxID=1640501 RepID=A0ABV8CWL2_9STRE